MHRQQKQRPHRRPHMHLHQSKRADPFRQPGRVNQARQQRGRRQRQQPVGKPPVAPAAGRPPAHRHRLPRGQNHRPQRRQGVDERRVDRPIPSDGVGEQAGEHRQRNQDQQGQVGQPAGTGTAGGPHPADRKARPKAATARARWLIRFFSSSPNSARVRPSTSKMGS